MLYALNAASAKLQRSVQSEVDVFNAVKERIAEIGLRGGVSLLDETGTKFNIYLPAQDIARVTSPIREVAIKLDGAGKRVLVVEDDQATLIAIQTLLEAHNYQVLTASNGIEALQRYERDMGSIELVVSDLVMPQMGGLALFRKISECWPEAKLIFVTDHPMDRDSQNLLERGNVSWLQKPFSIQQFNQVVRALLEPDHITVP